MTRNILVSVMTAVSIAACGAKQDEPTVVEGETEVAVEATVVEATVVTYEEDLLQVEHDDGTVERFDATELDVVYPESLTGRKFFICHSPPAGEDSVWRQAGTSVVFELTEEDLHPVGCAFVSEEAVKVKEVEE